MLEIKNLHVNVDGREILKGLGLTLPAGEVHAIMGPNGSGKSTLAYVLAGRDGYEVTSGSITWKGQNLLDLAPAERAAAGVFLAFQYPMEIPGVATMTFLRTAVNAVRKARGEKELSTPDFLQARARQGETAQDRRRDAEAAAQCRLLGRREEAERDPANGAARAFALRARRDRFRPRHRRDPHRLRRRQCAPQARPRHRSSSPIISGCSIISCRTACTCCRTGAWRARAGLSLRSSSNRRATPNSAARRPKGATMELSVQQFRTKAEQAYLDTFESAREALPGAGDAIRLWLAATRRSRLMAGSGCRIAASRPGNTPTSARC